MLSFITVRRYYVPRVIMVMGQSVFGDYFI
jgi:hypothetical protein